jgi:hypothetical protein
MKPSLRIRAVALIASAGITFGVFELFAAYGLPTPPPLVISATNY